MTTQQTFLKRIKACSLIVALAFLMVMGASPSAQAENAADASVRCPGERGRQISEGIRSAGNSYMVLSQDAALQLAASSFYQDTVSPTRYLRGQIKDTYCISLVFDYMTALRKLLSLDWIDLAIDAIIEQVLDWACTAIGQVINNVLANICLPSISFLFSPTLTLPNLENRRTCDGASLADLVRVQSVPAFQYQSSPQQYQRYPMSRYGRDGRY